MFSNILVSCITLLKHCYGDYFDIRSVICFNNVAGISQSSAADLFACDSVLFQFRDGVVLHRWRCLFHHCVLVLFQSSAFCDGVFIQCRE